MVNKPVITAFFTQAPKGAEAVAGDKRPSRRGGPPPADNLISHSETRNQRSGMKSYAVVKRLIISGVLSIAIALCGLTPAAAQRYPERHHIRAGNRAYERGEWAAAEEQYRRALAKSPDDTTARFNLGNALYRQERWDEALTEMKGVDAFYNMGNAFFEQTKLKDALEAYKNAMRADPSDMDAKFNYAYVKKLLEDQQQNDGKDEDEQNQEEQGQEQKEDQQEQKEQEQNQEQEQQASDGISRSDAAAMLDAMQAQEDRTQNKLDENRRGVAVGRSGKNW
jgi:hypothetical protein